MSAGFVNGIIQTNLTGLVYANGTSTQANRVAYSTNIFTVEIFGSITKGTTTITSQNCTVTSVGMPNNLYFFDINVIFSSTTGTGDLVIIIPDIQLVIPANANQTCLCTTNIPWPNNQATVVNAVTKTNPIGPMYPSGLVLTAFNNTNALANVQCPTTSGTYRIQISGILQNVWI